MHSRTSTQEQCKKGSEKEPIQETTSANCVRDVRETNYVFPSANFVREDTQVLHDLSSSANFGRDDNELIVNVLNDNQDVRIVEFANNKCDKLDQDKLFNIYNVNNTVDTLTSKQNPIAHVHLQAYNQKACPVDRRHHQKWG